MDAYSISNTSPAHRTSSRIWRDFKNCRGISVREISPDEMSESIQGGFAGKRRPLNPTRPPHVGIVGAGLAGLRCADILLQNGFQVTILEGRDRLGGRVHQQRLPSGHLVDLGPNWIHGTNDNPIFDLAKQTQTATGHWGEESGSYVFDESGALLSEEDGDSISGIMWSIINDAFAHSEQNSATIDANESLLDYFKKQVTTRIPDSKPGYAEKRRLVLQLAEEWGAFVGSPVCRQSLKFFWLEECIDGVNLFCAGTYKDILELIAKRAKESATIKYRTKVQNIRTNVGEDSSVALYTDAGEAYEFDEVVLTTPLGWLKRNLEAFEPALPQRLDDAINSVGYGCLEKVYLSFSKPFWLGPGRTIKGFGQWLKPTYAPDSNPQGWHQEVVELASLDPDAPQSTLLFYIHGEQSQFMTAEAAKFPTKEKKDAYYYAFFKPYYSRLPNYNENSPDCQPIGCIATDWLHDDLAGNGSYENFQVGLEDGSGDIEAMREGVPDRGLWLAGEHTAPFVACGTTTGAYWSGEAVGGRIAEAYGKKSDGGISK